jgi:acyl-CoA thioesterase
MGALDDALALDAGGDGIWRAVADGGYQAPNGMYGGWTAAIALNAVVASNDEEEKVPSAFTVNFVGRVDPGSELVIRTRRLGGSRSVSHWSSELTAADDGRTLAFASAVLTTRPDTDSHVVPTMPDVPPPEEVEPLQVAGLSHWSDVRGITGWPPFGNPDTVSLSWVRDRSGRPIDAMQLAFVADQAPPRSWYWSEAPRPSATLTMSVYFHATADELAAVGDDHVLNDVVATRGARATSGQQLRMWSRRGVLLATSEQLAWYR